MLFLQPLLSFITITEALSPNRSSTPLGTWSNLIRTGNWHQIYATMQLSAKERMVTLEKHLTWLVSKGQVSPEIALQYANDPSQFAQGGPGAPSAPAQARRPKVG